MQTFTRLSRDTFGPFSRYALDTCRTRFGTIEYFIADAEVTDDLDLPAVFVQTDDRTEIDHWLGYLAN